MGAEDWVRAGAAAAAVVAAAVVAVILLLWFQRHETKPETFALPGAQPPDALASYPDPRYNPYTVLQKKLSAVRGYRNDAYNQTPFYRLPGGLDAYHRTGADVRPEDISAAERADWYAGGSAADTFDPARAREPGSETLAHHEGGPEIDYDAFVTDLVADPRLVENHRKWVHEMQPWSGVAMKVDTLDVEPYIDFRGLRRPQAVVQYNPFMLTEVDTYDLAPNPKFNFRG